MSHRSRVGGLWNEIGKLQFDFMVKEGLKPHHKLLDIGCGCLRGGVWFIKYLDGYGYYGMDKNADLLEAGRREAKKAGIEGGYILTCSGNFSFGLPFGTRFDFAIAQSLFTHLNLNEILLCLVELEKALKPEGRCYASFFTCAKGDYSKTVQHFTDDNKIVNTQAAFSRSIHYTFDQLQWAGEWAGLKCDYIGGWNHPRKQEMIVYYR
jgi:ubiquinone/menaquinone biosynthesis C-methylase UbiE